MFTREQKDDFLRRYLVEKSITLQFNLAAPTIITISVTGDDSENTGLDILSEILRMEYGADLCGPSSNVPSRQSYQSFSFDDQDLLDQAHNLFAFPEEFHAGSLIWVWAGPDFSEISQHKTFVQSILTANGA